MFLKIIWSVIARDFADNESFGIITHLYIVAELQKTTNRKIVYIVLRGQHILRFKCVQKCLASHKEGTTTSRRKHQHPKRTYCQFLTCVGKSPCELYSGTLLNQSNTDTDVISLIKITKIG